MLIRQVKSLGLKLMSKELVMNEGAIINQISDSVKHEIEEQVEFLKGIGKFKCGTERDYYLAMQDGANAVLTIIKRDKICDQGTDNWLQKLSYDQLVYAKGKAHLLITKMNEAEKIEIWCAYSECSPVYYFKTYKEAISKSIEIIKDEASEKVGCKHRISVTPRRILESEINDYLTN